MGEVFVALIDYLPLLLLVLAYLTGRFVERRHYRSIKRRENETLSQALITSEVLESDRVVRSAELAVGSVVVSVDYFKRVLGAFRNIFGGEVRSYASVLDRGKREALLRLKESHPDADVFLNCRLQTAALLNQQGRGSGSVEVVAYGTAVTFGK